VADRARQSRAPVVLELSSWQLENLGERGISPHVAVVTNVLPDHADRYRTFADYVRAKRQILAHQTPGDVAALNWDNPVTRVFWRQTRGRSVAFGRHDPGCSDSVFTAGGWVWRRTGRRTQRLFALSAWRLPGRHNVSNLLAATAVAVAYDIAPAAMAARVAAFSGLPFRQEVIARRQGVTWVNDTTATTPEAAIAALATWGNRRRSVILIAGGSDKRLPDASFRALGSVVAAAAKFVVLFPGQGSARIARWLPARVPRASAVGSMADAVALAAAAAQRGDTVLLSPACASFGLFTHEFDRGIQFNQCVRQSTRDWS
jgi:UDP-N-acetylmuramoylalanine--D-glutamate ligase